MAQPVVTAPSDAWARVGEMIRERRYALGLSQEDLGVSKAVANALENARQESFTENTLRRVCRALLWAPDSIERILRGDAPVDVSDQEPLGSAEEEYEALKAELARLSRRLDRLERRQR